MAKEAVHVLKLFLVTGVALSGTASALFKFMSSTQGDERHAKTREWFAQRWAELERSPLKRLHELVADWYMKTSRLILAKFFRMPGKASPFTWMLGLSMIICLGFIIFRWSWLAIVGILGPLVLFILGALVFSMIWEPPKTWTTPIVRYFRWHCAGLAIATLIVIIHWLGFVSCLKAPATVIASLADVPLFLGFVLFLYYAVAYRRQLPITGAVNYTVIFSFMLAISFLLTEIAMSIGHAIVRDQWVPNTVQMLFANAGFDLVTVVLTYFIFSLARARESLWRVPIAVILDLTLAGILAMLSLVVGLAFTPHEISIQESWHNMWGWGLDGRSIDLGPLFWVMHTTFLPTTVYLLFVLLAWLAKCVILPTQRFFGVGKDNPDPLKLTSELLALVATLLGAPLMILQVLGI